MFGIPSVTWIPKDFFEYYCRFNFCSYGMNLPDVQRITPEMCCYSSDLSINHHHRLVSRGNTP
jgi:hypothetical protein